MTFDLTRLKQSVDNRVRYIDNCSVLDIGSGDFPRQIIVRPPGSDGARLIAINNAIPNLTTSDTVRISLSAINQIAYVEGYGIGSAIPPISAESPSIIVKNTSGAAASAGDVGYLDASNEYQTTTTAEDEQSTPVAVVIGGANNSDIYVTRGEGRLSLNYTGSAPSSGDYLTFSATAGDCQARSTMHPGVIALARAGGSGGVVEAELLLRTLPIPISPSEDVYETDSTKAPDSDFVATIDSLPGGAAVRYDTPSSGSEDNLTPQTTTKLAKVVLHNTTRGDSALIDDNDTTGGAGYDGEITLTDTVPGTWQAGDTITIRSQTNTSTSGSSYFVDFEITSSEIPDLSRAILCSARLRDTGAASEFLMFHPFETNVSQKRRLFLAQVANVYNDREILIPLTARKFCALWTGSGANTFQFTLRADLALIAG